MKKKYIKATLKEPIYSMVEVEFDFSSPLAVAAQVEQNKRNLSHEIRQKLMERITTLHIDDLSFEFIDKEV